MRKSKEPPLNPVKVTSIFTYSDLFPVAFNDDQESISNTSVRYENNYKRKLEMLKSDDTISADMAKQLSALIYLGNSLRPHEKTEVMEIILDKYLSFDAQDKRNEEYESVLTSFNVAFEQEFLSSIENADDKITLINQKRQQLNEKYLDKFVRTTYLTNERATQLLEEDSYILDQVPSTELWRLYVDPVKQRKNKEQGWVSYEKREPGCIARMHEAFNYCLNLKGPITTEKLEEVNRIAMKHTEYRSGGVQGTTSGVAHFSISGLTESVEPEAAVCFKPKHYLLRKWTDKPLAAVPGFINNYEKKLQNANEPITKLRAIVEFCSIMAKNHPFKDGNCRTMSVILLNRELMRNGFSPCVLDDPNMFEGRVSPNEMMLLVEQGIYNFRYLIQNNKIPSVLNSLSTSYLDITAKVQRPKLKPFQLSEKVNSAKQNDTLKDFSEKYNSKIQAIADDLSKGADTSNEDSIIAKLKELMQQGEKLDYMNAYCQTLANLAARNNQWTLLKFLAENEPESLLIEDFSEATPLDYAVIANRLDIVKCIVKHAPDTVTNKRNGKMPIVYAAYAGNYDIVEYLADKAPESLKIGDFIGRPPIAGAIESGKLEVVKYIYEKAPETLWTINKEGVFAFSDAVLNIDILKYLSEQDSEILTTTDDLGKTLMHYAAENVSNIDIFKFLVKNSKASSLAKQDKDGKTALHYAVATGNLEVVKFLVEQNVEAAKITDISRKSPIAHAVSIGNIEIVKYLAKKAPETLNYIGVNRTTLLYEAIKNGHLSIVKLLVEQDINKLREAVWSVGDMPIHQAANNAADNAADNKNSEILKYLAKEDPETLTIKTKWSGDTPIDILVNKKGDSELIQYLTELRDNYIVKKKGPESRKRKSLLFKGDSIDSTSDKTQTQNSNKTADITDPKKGKLDKPKPSSS